MFVSKKLTTDTRNNIQGKVAGIQKFSTEDGPGIRTTVFLKGCPLNCIWCHNPELIKSRDEIMYTKSRCLRCFNCIDSCKANAISKTIDGISIDRSLCNACMSCVSNCYSLALKSVASIQTVGYVMEKVMQDYGYYTKTNGGLTISGGEPLLQSTFVEALVDEAQSRNVHVAIDTSGYGTRDIVKRLALKANLILFDIKSVNNEKHLRLTGKSNELILSNLKMLSEDPSVASKISIRLPLISNINDTEDDIESICILLKQCNLRTVTLIPYHSMGNVKRVGIGLQALELKTPSKSKMTLIQKHFVRYGIKALLNKAEQ